MLEFQLAPKSGAGERIGFDVATLIVAGWTGRDEAALRHHIEELAAIGVPRPSSVPVFYRNSALNVTQRTRLEVLGPDTSGEAEPVRIQRLEVGDVGLFKGEKWIGNEGAGIVHRSPAPAPGTRRLLLTLDWL